MSFTSLQYYLFLAVVALLYFNIPMRFRRWVLLVSSYIFYTSFEPRAVFFIIVATLLSYGAALMMFSQKNERARQVTLLVVLGIELGLLFLTKYWNPVANQTGLMPTLAIIVPLGISFYTFQTISYLVDVYRRQLAPERNLVRYAVFLSFFPHLLAGPIEPAQRFLPQLQPQNQLAFDRKHLGFGVMLILFGLFKKLVIAERVAPIVDLVFDSPLAYQGLAIALAVLLARYQLYCDFSGYTDIARGSARTLGIELTDNFRQPFLSTSISEFWRRWHISLGDWIRSYVFFPLLASPIARLGSTGLVIMTFLILGLWHGGTVNFLFYGLWQGVFVAIDSSTRQIRHGIYQKIGLTQHPRLLKTLCIAFTFFLLLVPPMLFFRSPDLKTTSQMLSQFFYSPWSTQSLAFIGESAFLTYSLGVAILAIVAMEVTQWWVTRLHAVERLWSRSQPLFWTVALGFLILILTFGYLQSNSRFIYMNF